MSTTITAGHEDDGLTAAIRREHEAAGTAARSAIEHAMECGRLLAQARQGIAHGGWESYVRDRCGIAPRTARVYLRLDRERDRLPNRQHVAGLTVREAVQVLTEPKLKAEAVPPAEVRDGAGRGDEPRLAVPSWYRPGHAHFGAHESGWCFKVWPHPHGEPWAHYFILSTPSGFPGDEGGTLVGPKRGIRSDFLICSMEMQCVNGMPSLNDPGWEIGREPVDAAVLAAEPFYNSWLYADDDDYRRRGMGINPRRRKAREAASA